jgi:hypothetical protein
MDLMKKELFSRSHRMNQFTEFLNSFTAGVLFCLTKNAVREITITKRERERERERDRDRDRDRESEGIEKRGSGNREQNERKVEVLGIQQSDVQQVPVLKAQQSICTQHERDPQFFLQNEDVSNSI